MPEKSRSQANRGPLLNRQLFEINFENLEFRRQGCGEFYFRGSRMSEQKSYTEGFIHGHASSHMTSLLNCTGQPSGITPPPSSWRQEALHSV